MQSSVLFVDDEELICRSYRNICETDLPDFSVETARSAEEGIALLGAQRFDVVVTDLTMPGLDGIEFLAAVNRAQPDAARIIVSAFADRLKVARCLFVAHRYFDKPVEPSSLVRLLRQLASFRDIVGNDKVRRIVGGLGSLPGPPEIFLKLQAVLASPTCTIQEVGAVVEQDPAVTAKLLQIVNSAHYGFPYKILDAAHAVQVVGVDSVRTLVLGLHAFTSYQDRPGKKSPPPELWDHSLRVAFGAREIARGQALSQVSCERAFLAGLLHDVGRIVIHANSPDEQSEILKSAQENRIPLSRAELGRFGATQAEIGAYLLALWGIDEEVTRLVQFQEELEAFSGEEVGAAVALHVAHFADVRDGILYPFSVEAVRRFGFEVAEELARVAGGESVVKGARTI